jgi:predicted alpha/beta hydrolase family esterase
MRAADVDILMVPGWQGSGPEHWQSRWERNLTTARRIELQDWTYSDKDKWVGAIIAGVATGLRPVVLVAHSLGVMAAVHAALKLPQGSIAAAFLVAPADVDNPQTWPITDGCAWPDAGLSFAPVPLTPLCFPSMLLASSDDLYCRPERARHFAAAWGSELVEVGPAGHITAESGHGPWPDGVLRFARFLAGLGP